jgi:hypothetical protein
MLKPIGWWIETVADENFPAPQELTSKVPVQGKTKLADYLGRGLRLIQYRGYSWCRFVCGIEDNKMGSWDLTDGIWVWPEGLSHYVDVHNVILPEEFVRHAMSEPSPTKPSDSHKYDEDYWIRWSADRRVPAIRKGLQSTLIAAQAQVAAKEAELADALERQLGVTSKQCIWNRCARKALSGKLVCAEHALSGTDAAVARIPLYTGLREYLRQLTPA